MKPFHNESLIPSATEDSFVPLIVEVSALVMRRFRTEVRAAPENESLNFTQIRALACLHITPGLSLSEVSSFLGLQPPTTSKTIEGLVQEGLVRRESDADDRRRLTLYVTEEGERLLTVATRPAQEALGQVFAVLSDEDRAVVERAMRILLPIVNSTADPGARE
jgi:DNA-binding MarR family transcriptional regulator